jgi:hypothetical protein
MISTKDGFKLSTGKEFYANCSLLSVSPSTHALFEGYDGDVSEMTFNESTKQCDPMFTPEERHEISQYMQNLWAAWEMEPATSDGDSAQEQYHG